MFKVGDKLVAISSELHRGIRDVQEIVDDTWIVFKHHGFHKGLFRHATPEEIAAGHRIDTNTGVTVITPSGTSKVKGGLTAFIDMGDDSHIENHVSPNCKKFDERVNSNETN